MQKLLFAALCAAIGSSAQGAQVYINSNQFFAGPGATTVWTAKYRISNSGFDQSLSIPTAQNVNADLGNRSALSGQAYSFTLQNVVGQGVRLSMQKQPSSTLTVLSWGSAALGGANAATLNTLTPFSASYNTLKLQSRATSGSGNPNPSFTVSAFALTGPTTSGSFVSNTVTSTTGDAGSPGFFTQYAVAKLNLATVNWTLTGTVSGIRAGGSGDELSRFTVDAQQANPVPEPATLAALLIGAVGIARRRGPAKA